MKSSYRENFHKLCIKSKARSLFVLFCSQEKNIYTGSGFVSTSEEDLSDGVLLSVTLAVTCSPWEIMTSGTHL